MSAKKREEYGGSVYDQQYFTDDELRSAAEIRAAAQEGRTSWDDAHKYVENIRGKYGYSGGGDGASYAPSGAAQNGNGLKTSFNSQAGTTTKKNGSGTPGSFTYEDAPSYVNRYQDQINELTRQILNREAFSYDPEADPTYRQYRDTYTREGQKAMQDTLGQVSARTGGLASSYAGTVAQQSYNDYMAKLADKVPELRQLAYSMYQDEEDKQRNDLSMLVALEQGDYAKYADLLAKYNTDRSFDYGAYRDNVSDLRYGDELALSKAQTLAAAGDFSGYKALGYTDSEIARLKAAYDASVSGYGGYSGGGGGSGYRTGGTDTPEDSASGDIYTKMYNAGIRSEHTASAWLQSAGYSPAEAGKIAAYFATDWMRNGKSGDGDPLADGKVTVGATGVVTPRFSDYGKAVEYMKQKGVPSANASGAMTKADWTRRKAAYANSGQGGAAVSLFDSYQEYLTYYVRDAIEQYGGK